MPTTPLLYLEAIAIYIIILVKKVIAIIRLLYIYSISRVENSLLNLYSTY